MGADLGLPSFLLYREPGILHDQYLFFLHCSIIKNINPKRANLGNCTYLNLAAILDYRHLGDSNSEAISPYKPLVGYITEAILTYKHLGHCIPEAIYIYRLLGHFNSDTI